MKGKIVFDQFLNSSKKRYKKIFEKKIVDMIFLLLKHEPNITK